MVSFAYVELAEQHFVGYLLNDRRDTRKWCDVDLCVLIEFSVVDDKSFLPIFLGDSKGWEPVS